MNSFKVGFDVLDYKKGEDDKGIFKEFELGGSDAHESLVEKTSLLKDRGYINYVDYMQNGDNDLTDISFKLYEDKSMICSLDFRNGIQDSYEVPITNAQKSDMIDSIVSSLVNNNPFELPISKEEKSQIINDLTDAKEGLKEKKVAHKKPHFFTKEMLQREVKRIEQQSKSSPNKERTENRKKNEPSL